MVRDVAGFNGKNLAGSGGGNIVDENEHVVERYTMTTPDTIAYEARVDVIRRFIRGRGTLGHFPLRRQPAGTELIEYDCIEGERSEIHYPGAPKK